MTKWVLAAFAAIVLVFSTILGGATAATMSAGSAAVVLAAGEHESAETSVAGGVGCGVEGEGAKLAANAIRAAGWPQVLWLPALKVVGAESGYNPTAGNVLKDGRTHRGLFQMSSLHLLEPDINPSGKDLRYDPVENARMALRLYQRDLGFAPKGPWESSRSKWENYADEATAGLVAATGTPCAAGLTPAPRGGDLLAGVPAGSCTVSKGTTVATPTGTTTVCSAGPFVVDVRLAPFVVQMLNDARAAGHVFTGGAWRSHENQKRLYAQNCRRGSCSPPTARPGTSQHEFALALDIGCNGGSAFAFGRSPCYPWMVANAARYKLKQLPSEKWHWSTTGR